MSAATKITWTYERNGVNEGLRAEFEVDATGMVCGPVVCTPLGELMGGLTAEDEGWNFGVDCLISMLIIAISKNILQNPDQFRDLVEGYLEELSHDVE